MDQITKHPSNWECKEPIAEFIERYHVPCLYNVDTRAVTRVVREQGIMKAIIVSADKSEAEIKAMLAERFDSIDYAQARQDVEPFIHDSSVLNIWSADFFKQITEGLTAV